MPVPLLLFVDHRGQPGAGAWNMAVDEALLEAAEQPAILRVYSWDGPHLSLGYFQKAVEAVQGFPPEWVKVRRWTGGGAVPHDGDVTLSLIAPRSHSLAGVPPRESYGIIHQALAATLIQFGLPVELTQSAGGAGQACFQKPVPHDLMLGGRKIGGGAQRRTRAGLLHQGSLQEVALPAEWPGGFAGSLGLCLTPWQISDATLRRADELTREKYGSAAWLARH